MEKLTLKIGQTFSEAAVCAELGIKIPKLNKASRESIVKQVANFQMKKAFAVSAYNRQLRAAGINAQLKQSSHTNYKVVSVADKRKSLTKTATTFSNAVLTF